MISPSSNIITGSIHDFEKHLTKTWSKIYVLVDENTQEHCLPRLFENLDFFSEAEVLVVEANESSKSIEIAYQLWGAMIETGGDRNSLLVNLGGGMISDLGGFVASTFKRGIDFIHIPTTLLAQVDAAVGGKTGVNFEGYKNQIGTFSFPEFTLIDTSFLETLPEREYLSGLGEVIKYGLIAEASIIDLLQSDKRDENLSEIIKKCIKIKSDIVEKDPLEKNERKKLNFGHTVGHAIETVKKGDLLHGEAIAYGMLCESFLSFKLGLLSENEVLKIEKIIYSFFAPIKLTSDELIDLYSIMKHDKKNSLNEINFSLLDSVGSCLVNQTVSTENIQESLNKYLA